MDTTERQEILAELAFCDRALSGVSPDRLEGLLTLKAGYQTRLRDLIPEAPSPVSDQQWQQVSGELQRDTNAVSSHIATGTKTLPVVSRTQANRVRLEEENCLLIRQPIFSQYEQAILGGARQFFGLTGPQGFGKSTFLQYLAVKHCHGDAYVVLYLPFCPAHEESLKRDLAVAFYRGCRIAGLVGYPELTCGDTLVRMVQRCVGFAFSQQKTLLLVVDQMNTEPRDVFQHTVGNLRNIGTLDNVKVVLSSSTSHVYGPVFGNLFWHLKRYSDKLTAEEAAALSTEYSSMGVNVRAEDLSGLPFQAAALKLRSTPGMPSLTELATDLADHLLTLPNTNEKMDTRINEQKKQLSELQKRKTAFKLAHDLFGRCQGSGVVTLRVKGREEVMKVEEIYDFDTKQAAYLNEYLLRYGRKLADLKFYRGESTYFTLCEFVLEPTIQQEAGVTTKKRKV